MIGFFLVASTLWLGMHAFVGWRLVGKSSLKGRPRRAAWLALVVLAVLPLIAMTSNRTGGELGSDRGLYFVGMVSMGMSSLLVAFTAATEALMVTGRSVAWVRRKIRPDAPEWMPDPARRQFLADAMRVGVVGSATGLTATGYANATRVPHVREVSVAIAGLHPDLEGFRIAQLTDVHIGPTIRGDWLEQVVATVNELGPDVIAVTGDLVDGHVETLGPELAALEKLAAPHGAFFVTGNHEYYWDGPAWCEHVRSRGVEPLLNRHVVLDHGEGRILLAGCTDYSASRRLPSHASDPAGARLGAPTTDVSILLAHQPRSVFAAAKAGYDLQLSGHTHGGQYFPFSALIGLFQPYGAGLDRLGDTQIYVSRGTGYWGPPNRAGSDSEITLLTLTRAEA